MKRRQFIQGLVGSAAVGSAIRTRPVRAHSVMDRVQVGVIGCGTRGRFVAARMREVPDVEIVAVCDVYEQNLRAAREWVGSKCAAFANFRRLLDQPDVDAVLIATPDHWHAIPAILACQAGKDVYVEKPLAHNIREGQAIVRAARNSGRVVQVGTQQRSAAHFDQMRQIIQTGALGRVHFIRIWNYRNIYPGGIGRQPDSDPPPGLDWDFYLGPAPRVPFNPNRFLGNFRWFWDYAGGIITDWGTHRLDSMHHVMGVDQPRTAAAAGGRFALDDGGDVPDVLQVTYEYPGFVVSYEASALCGHGMGGRTPGRAYYRARATDDRPNGLAFYGTSGALFADRLGFEIYPELKPEAAAPRRTAAADTPELYRMERQTGSSPDSTFLHVQNFIQCVRTRARPVADVEVGHRASTAAHLGNIAYRTGRKLIWDGQRDQIVGDAEASRLLQREARKPWDLI